MTETIKTLVLGAIGGLSSSFLSYAFYKRQKNADLKFDHKKYILNKRIEAYEQILPFINKFQIERLVALDEKNLSDKLYSVSAIFVEPAIDYSSFKNFFVNYTSATNSNWSWYSFQLRSLLTDSINTMADIQDEIHATPNFTMKTVLDIAEKKADSIYQLGTSFRQVYFRDINKFNTSNKHSIKHYTDILRLIKRKVFTTRLFFSKKKKLQ